MAIKFTNFAYSTLAVGIGSGDTTIAVAGGHGARFPTLGVGDYFYATLENSGGTREIIKVTARAVDSLTVVRAQDNTTAVAWLAGDSIALRLNAKAIEEAVVGTLLGSNNLSDVANVATSRTNLGAAASGLATASGLTMSTARVLGRTTASTGAIEELTEAQVAAFTAAASTTAQGVSELATSAETQTGTDAARVVTPEGLGDTVLGMGQTYQDMTASRAMATLYTNSTGRPIVVSVRCANGVQCNYTLNIDGNAVSIIKHLASDAVTQCAYGIVPNGSTYQITLSAGTASVIAWWELR